MARSRELSGIQFTESFENEILRIANNHRLTKEMEKPHMAMYPLHLPSVFYRPKVDKKHAEKMLSYAIMDKLRNGHAVVVEMPDDGRVLGIRQAKNGETEIIQIKRFGRESRIRQTLRDPRIIVSFNHDQKLQVAIVGTDPLHNCSVDVVALSGTFGRKGFTIATEQEVLVGQVGVTTSGELGSAFGIANPYDPDATKDFCWLVTGQVKTKRTRS